MPHLTNLPPNPPEEFSMLKEIFDQQVFELCIHEENSQKAYYIPYMMNDALECYLILEHCRMTGEYQPEANENEEEEPCSGQLEEKDEYSCVGVPLFRRNGYRQSGGRKPLFRNRDTALN
ncbi:DUF3878 family protein [Lacrimispora saccharolytica]|nr:DUF3878 family protein [Lacrimispora saccharolytica]